MANSVICSAIFLALTLSSTALASNSPVPEKPNAATGSEQVVAPYLREDAPVFNLTAAQFREKFNAAYPHMALAEYRPIKTPEVKSPLTRAASRINSTLYSSVALDKNQRTIRSLQLTYIPAEPTEEKAEALAKTEKMNKTILTNYMTAFINLFEPTLTAEKSQQKAIELLAKGKGAPFYQQTEGTLRFVIADHNEKGITFAIEPIKLSLSDK